MERTHFSRDLIFFITAIITFVIIGSLNLSPLYTGCVLLCIYALYLYSVISEDIKRKTLISQLSSLTPRGQFISTHSNSTFIFGESVLPADMIELLEKPDEPFIEIMLKVKKRTIEQTKKGSFFVKVLYFAQWPLRLLV